ncbi:MAG: hypothetical protein V5A88_09970 [Candidatus Thermoplasmatota archaeon]
MIEFEEDIEKSLFYDPSEEEEKQDEIAIRHDPLTGKSCRILDKPLPLSKDVDIEDEIKGGFCPFCPDRIYDIGARDSRVLNNELLENGEAVLLSNLNPYAEKSLVIRLNEEHYLPLESFREKHFTDAFELVLKYLERSSAEGYPTVMMNYLKPAGSTIVHPHLQLLISDTPMDLQNRVIKAAQEYYEEHGSNYWSDLLEEERDGERYIGKIGGCEWKTPFAPKGLEHIQGISLRDLRSMDREDLQAVSLGIVETLEYYADLDLNSFNLSILISPKSNRERFATVIDLVARSSLDRYYWCDVFALSKLQDEPYSHKYPEDIAKEARSFFG